MGAGYIQGGAHITARALSRFASINEGNFEGEINSGALGLAYLECRLIRASSFRVDFAASSPRRERENATVVCNKPLMMRGSWEKADSREEARALELYSLLESFSRFRNSIIMILAEGPPLCAMLRCAWNAPVSERFFGIYIVIYYIKGIIS